MFIKNILLVWNLIFISNVSDEMEALDRFLQMSLNTNDQAGISDTFGRISN